MPVHTHFQLPLAFDHLQAPRRRDTIEALPPGCLVHIVMPAADGIAITNIWTDEPTARAFYAVRAQATGMAFPSLVFTDVLAYQHESPAATPNA